jgi:hypothetical protein
MYSTRKSVEMKPTDDTYNTVNQSNYENATTIKKKGSMKKKRRSRSPKICQKSIEIFNQSPHSNKTFAERLKVYKKKSAHKMQVEKRKAK